MQVGWPTVWADYKSQEEETWRPLYEQRGFKDWWEWRSTYFTDLHLPSREWQRVSVEQPEKVIPTWFVGGYPGLKRYRPMGERFTTFATVAASPLMAQNDKVQAIVREMRPLTFVLLRCGDEFAVIDGFHRGVAAVIRALRGGVLPETVAYIATIPLSEKYLFDAFRLDRPLITK